MFPRSKWRNLADRQMDLPALERVGIAANQATRWLIALTRVMKIKSRRPEISLFARIPQLVGGVAVEVQAVVAVVEAVAAVVMVEEMGMAVVERAMDVIICLPLSSNPLSQLLLRRPLLLIE
jgi:hypothetical protein